MAKGGTTPGPTQSTTVKNDKQSKLTKLAMPYAENFATGGVPELPDFSLVAGFDPLQTQGQEMVLGSTDAMQNIVGSAGQGNAFLSSGAALDPNSNPALRATIDASTRPIIQNLMETVMPSIRNNAVATGNFGSSRQGIAQGLATGRAATAVGDTAAKVATAGYNSGLDAMGKAQANAAGVAGAQAIPGMTTSGVGDVRQALAQMLLGEQGQRHNYEQTGDLMMARELMSLAQGVPGGTAISSASVPEQDPMMQYLGMAIQAAGAAAKMAPMMAASDRNLKDAIIPVGELSNGLKLYTFHYKDDPFKTRHWGVMAQEVEDVLPSAVVMHNGVKSVNYRELFKSLENVK